MSIRNELPRTWRRLPNHLRRFQSAQQTGLVWRVHNESLVAQGRTVYSECFAKGSFRADIGSIRVARLSRQRGDSSVDDLSLPQQWGARARPCLRWTCLLRWVHGNERADFGRIDTAYQGPALVSSASHIFQQVRTWAVECRNDDDHHPYWQ